MLAWWNSPASGREYGMAPARRRLGAVSG